MAAQYDFIAGLDLSSLASASQAQIMQAINQIAPLSNIGGVIVGTTTPDVASNARFARYIWIDTTTATAPIVKVYDTSGAIWVAIGLGNDTVTEPYITQGGVSVYDPSDGTTKKIAQQTGTSGTRIGYIARVDSVGRYLELVPLSTILAAGTVPLTALVAGTDGHWLKCVSGVWTSTALDVVSLIGSGTLGLSKLSGGTADAILKVTAAGTGVETITAANLIDNLLSNGAIPYTKLDNSTASAGDMLRFDGTNWAEFTPSISINSVYSASSANNCGAAAVHQFTHGLVTTPKLVQAVLRCTSDELGYVAGDEVDISGVKNSADNIGMSVSRDATYVTLMQTAITGFQILHKSTGTKTSITMASWTPKVYAWK